jgi:hypothetical protein
MSNTTISALKLGMKFIIFMLLIFLLSDSSPFLRYIDSTTSYKEYKGIIWALYMTVVISFTLYIWRKYLAKIPNIYRPSKYYLSASVFIGLSISLIAFIGMLATDTVQYNSILSIKYIVRILLQTWLQNLTNNSLITIWLTTGAFIICHPQHFNSVFTILFILIFSILLSIIRLYGGSYSELVLLHAAYNFSSGLIFGFVGSKGLYNHTGQTYSFAIFLSSIIVLIFTILIYKPSKISLILLNK